MTYLTPTDGMWACDIEADGLLDKATRIWCACLINVVTKEEKEFVDAEAFNVWRSENPDVTFIGHNFLAYDAPMLNRFWGAKIDVPHIIDTYVLSQMYNPSYKPPKGLNPPGTPKDKRKGPHSLEAWGIRLNYRKGGHDDFSAYTPEMLKYCRRDTILTALLFRKLAERMRSVGFSEDGVELEHHAWHIIQNKQKRNGFPFNKKEGEKLYIELRAREEELKREIYVLWPPVLLPVGEYQRPYRLNGEPSKNYARHVEQYPRVELSADRRQYRVYDWVEFNLGSPIQRIEKLLELGWEPSAKTKAGNPKVDEDALLEFAEASGTPELKALAKWIVVNSRANMVNTWLEAYNEDTGAIHGRLFIASTLRYRHTSPNSANIPAVRTKKDDEGVEHIQYGEAGAWTYECRDLWNCGDPADWTLVGIDGTGIQNRCLIHGLIRTVGEERVRPFKELALEGDVHKRNIEVLGLANKPAAKKFYYTLMMGGGGARLAADQAQFGTKMTAKEGEEKRAAMIATIPGFQEFIDVLQGQLARTGRIVLCDDTPVLVPSPHMVVPYYLQGDESRLMKRAMIYVDEEVRRNKLSQHILKVADIHDEWQYRVRNPYVEQFKAIALPCFPRAGRSFKYNILIEGDAKDGRTWAQTH